MTNGTLCNVCCLLFQQSTESLSFDAPSTMEQASVSKQPHEVQWMYKSEISPLPEHNIDTTDVPDF